MEQHKKPCSDCPFKRDSMKGWLAGYSAREFANLANSEHVLHCHKSVNEIHGDGEQWVDRGDETPQCAGRAIFAKNGCKQFRNPEIMRWDERDENIFSFPSEFIEHHTLRPLTPPKSPSEG